MTADDLLVSWSREVFRPKCNPGFQSLHCMARLDQDVSAVLPYLNAELGGDQYVEDPPAVTFQVHGKLITVYGREIAVNALSGEEEADKILAWLRGEINRVWRARQDIEPSYVSRSRPQVFPLLQLLPQSNCGACGQPTCMVFAVRLTEGALGPQDCPELSSEAREQMGRYLREHPPAEA
jgi:ArsR family metal-binding transcriptional regulator